MASRGANAKESRESETEDTDGTVDNKLEHILKNTSGHFHAQQEYTWIGKECRAALDHVLTWNYRLPPQTARPIPKSHKKFDHCQIWTHLPHLDFPKRANTALDHPTQFLPTY